MSEQTWWYLARAGGIVAALLLVATMVLGTLLATRAMRAVDRPAWLLAMHRWFSTLTIVATGLHLVGLVADDFVHFGWKEIMVPGASSWRPLAVGLGVVALYLLVLVEVSSLVMKRIPKRLWRSIHALSYGLVWLAIVHAALAGTDASNRVYRVVALTLTILATAAALVRVTVGRNGGQPGRAARSGARSTASVPDPAPAEVHTTT